MTRDPRMPLAEAVPVSRITWGGLREAGHMLAYLLPYRGKFAAAQLCLLLSSLAGLAFPYFTGRLIDSAYRGLGGEGAAAGWPPDGGDLASMALLLMLVLMVQAVCSFFQT